MQNKSSHNKDTVPTVSFFRVDELTSGQVNELIAIGGLRQSIRRQSNKRTEDRGMEDKVTKELRISILWGLNFEL